MEMKTLEEKLFDLGTNVLKEHNPYTVISKQKGILDADIIQIIDESGQEVNCTYDKFVEIFDKEGLTGFIL